MKLPAWLTSKNSFPLRIFLLALVLRLVPVLLSSNLGIGLDDMFQYDMLARSIVAGNGYRWYAQEDLYHFQGLIEFDLSSVEYDPRGVPTSFRPPLYPAFLALIYFLTGMDADRFFTARLVQTAVSAGLVPLTYFLAQRFFPGRERAARSAAWVITLYPLLLLYPLSLATENLFFLLMLGAVLALLVAAEKRTWGWFAVAGSLLGLTALTRSVALAFAGLAVLWVWFALRERKFAVLVFLAVTVVTLPWMVRNTLLHGRLTGIESALGYDLYLGYHPAGTGTFQFPQSLDLIPMLDDGLRDEIGRQRTLEFIQADPGRVPYLIVRRAGHFFGMERRALTYFYSNNFFGNLDRPLLLGIAALIVLPFMAVSCSSAFGLALTRRRPETWLLIIFLVGYITPHLLIIAEDRFHLTTVPFLAILAAQFWTGGFPDLKQRWLGSRGGKLAVLLAIAAVLLLLTNWGLEVWRDWDLLGLLIGPAGNTLYLAY